MSYRKNKVVILLLGASLLPVSYEAAAFSSYTSDIIEMCGGLGNELNAEYVSDSCTACHNDGQAKTAYAQANYEYFCPTADTAPVCTDADGDGYFAEGDSCGTLADFNDSDAAAYPGAIEDCGDGIDNDGNGLIDAADPGAMGCEVLCTDMDMDGYAIEGGSCGAIDCDDNNAAVNPGAVEICSDGLDNNCNGLTDTADMNAVDCPLNCTDNDGDGYSIEGGNCGAMDCDDSNAEVNPAALELCGDGVDNNCNGQVDSSDAVCQTADAGQDECAEPWWRSRGKRRHDHKKACVTLGDDATSEAEDDQEASSEDDEERRGHGRRHEREEDDDSTEHRQWFRSLR